jgi:zinc transport system substrate-binding protein
MKEKKIKKVLSRREFLAGTGVALLAGLLGGCKETITTTLDKTTTATKTMTETNTATQTMTQISTVTTEGAGDTLKIIASITPIADWVKQIGGEKVEVSIMVPAGYSPHTYEPTPSQMASVSKAGMFVKAGAGMEYEETWMNDIIAMNSNMLVVDCSEGVNILNGDTHIWNSPVNAQQMIMNIYNGFIERDPGNKNYYQSNFETYLEKLETLNSDIISTFNAYQNRNFLIYHPAFAYFASEYGLTQLAIEKEGGEPTAQGIQNCIDQAIEYNLNYVYVAPQFATSYANTIAEEIGGSVIYIDPLPSSYISNMISVAASLALEFE